MGNSQTISNESQTNKQTFTNSNLSIKQRQQLTNYNQSKQNEH